jgi:hypothetical protein
MASRKPAPHAGFRVFTLSSATRRIELCNPLATLSGSAACQAEGQPRKTSSDYARGDGNSTCEVPAALHILSGEEVDPPTRREECETNQRQRKDEQDQSESVHGGRIPHRTSARSDGQESRFDATSPARNETSRHGRRSPLDQVVWFES